MGETIVVASKLPHDLIIHLDQKQHTLNGCYANKKRLDKSNFTYPKDTVGLTTIPMDFWEEWKTKYADFTPLKKGFIFAQSKEKKILAEAREKANLKTGLERLDQEKEKGSKNGEED